MTGQCPPPALAPQRKVSVQVCHNHLNLLKNWLLYIWLKQDYRSALALDTAHTRGQSGWVLVKDGTAPSPLSARTLTRGPAAQ